MNQEEFIKQHPQGAELERLIGQYILKAKVGKTRFLQALLTNYVVTKKIQGQESGRISE